MTPNPYDDDQAEHLLHIHEGAGALAWCVGAILLFSILALVTWCTP